MEVSEQINKFTEFFELYYKKELTEKIQNQEKSITIDFKDLVEFNPELANLLLDQPEDTIKAGELAIEQLNISGDIKNFRLRLTNLPQSSYMMLGEARSCGIKRLFAFKGIIRQKSDVRPHTTSARFECPQCSNILSVLQLETQFREPSRCSCGRKGKFRLLSTELIDAQGMLLEECPEDLDGGQQPKHLNVLLKEDLVSPVNERKTGPGSKITVIGIVRDVPVILRNGAKSTRLDLMIEANNVIISEESFIDIKISPEEEAEIIKLSQDPELFPKLISSIAPSIYGYNEVKEALILQLFGGVQRKRKDGSIIRGDTHILLVGDAGIAKTELLKRIYQVAPKGRYVSGRGSSAAGLTATVVKDEFLKGWCLEAGAIVLATNGQIFIDEMDKMTPGDTSALHEAMESQQVSVSKANVQATLTAKTTVLAAANPKLGRFDPYDILGKQINMPPTLINRFDLIFPIKDIPNAKKDEELSGFILNSHMDKGDTTPPLDTKFIRKYIAYAKQKCKPKLTEEAGKEIQNYYMKLRKIYETEKSIPISPRQIGALARLSEASAKVRLAEFTTIEDAQRATRLLHFCLSEVGVDPETGKLDIDLIATGTSSSQRLHINDVKEIINTLEKTFGKEIPIGNIVEMAKPKGINEDKVEEIIERLKRSGDIYEPRNGVIQKL
jgi:replicative DNA helicase Mcm